MQNHNALRLIMAAYNLIREYAPTATPRTRADGTDGTPPSPPILFLQDIAGWALFSLMGMLTKQARRETPEDERHRISLAALMVPAIRCSGPEWLEDQLAKVFSSLSTPRVRARQLSDAEKAIEARLSPETLKRRDELRSRMAVKGVHNTLAAWDSAEAALKGYLRAAGWGTKALADAPMTDRELSRVVEKVAASINGAAAFYLGIFEDHATAMLCDEIVASAEWAELLGEWRVEIDDRTPSQGGGWVAPFEGISQEGLDAEDEADRRAELDSVFDEVQARTSAL